MPDDLTPDQRAAELIKSGAWQGWDCAVCDEGPEVIFPGVNEDVLESMFAAAIREAEARGERRGAAAERVACTAVVDQMGKGEMGNTSFVLAVTAATIRARGEG